MNKTSRIHTTVKYTTQNVNKQNMFLQTHGRRSCSLPTLKYTYKVKSKSQLQREQYPYENML